MEMKIVEDRENPLLGRREVRAEFPKGAGKVTRKNAIEAIASQLKVDPGKVVPIRFYNEAGTTNLNSLIYVYEDPAKAKRQLPEHIFLRNLGKEERKKLVDERRKSKAAQKQAAAKK